MAGSLPERLRPDASIDTVSDPSISHDWSDESPEAKAAWFRSLSDSERIEIFDAMTEMILENQPDIAEKKDAQPVPGRIRVLETPRR